MVRVAETGLSGGGSRRGYPTPPPDTNRSRLDESRRERLSAICVCSCAGGLRPRARRWPAGLGALADLELHPLVLLEGAETGSLDLGVVDEHVVGALVRRDEAEALFRVEPLHSSLCHVLQSFTYQLSRHDGSSRRGRLTAIPQRAPRRSASIRQTNLSTTAATRLSPASTGCESCGRTQSIMSNPVAIVASTKMSKNLAKLQQHDIRR